VTWLDGAMAPHMECEPSWEDPDDSSFLQCGCPSSPMGIALCCHRVESLPQLTTGSKGGVGSEFTSVVTTAFELMDFAPGISCRMQVEPLAYHLQQANYNASA